jgi:hypothetical protein
VDAKYRDFNIRADSKHSGLLYRLNPWPWVEAEVLAAMAPGGTGQLNANKITFWRTGVQEGINPDQFTFVQVVECMCYIMSTWRWQANSYKDCIKCLLLCQKLMFIIASLVCTPNVGSMEDTPNVFNKIPIWSLELPWFWDMWNFRKGKRCCSCLDKCNRKGVEPDPVTFVVVLNGCASMNASMFINRSYQYGY